MTHRHLDHLKETALAYAALYFNDKLPNKPGSKNALRNLKDHEAIGLLLEYYSKREDYYGQKESSLESEGGEELSPEVGKQRARYTRKRETSKKIVERLGYIKTKYELAEKDSKNWFSEANYSPLKRRVDQKGEESLEEYQKRVQDQLDQRKVSEIEGRVDYLNMVLLLTDELLAMARDSGIAPILGGLDAVEQKGWFQKRLKGLEKELDEAI